MVGYDGIEIAELVDDGCEMLGDGLLEEGRLCFLLALTVSDRLWGLIGMLLYCRDSVPSHPIFIESTRTSVGPTANDLVKSPRRALHVRNIDGAWL